MSQRNVGNVECFYCGLVEEHFVWQLQMGNLKCTRCKSVFKDGTYKLTLSESKNVFGYPEEDKTKSDKNNGWSFD